MAQERDNGLSLEMLGVNLPYSIEAEQAVLGAIIVDSAVLDTVSAILAPEHFYNKQNGETYKEMLLLSAAARPVDVVTVLNATVTAGVFASEEEAKSYLYDITQTVPTLSNVSTYAKIVYDKYIQRAIIMMCRDVINDASAGSENPGVLLDYIEQRAYEIRGGRDRSELWRMDSVVAEVVARLEQLSGPDRDKYRGLPTGFDSIDRVLTGLNKSDLIILAARPGVGKTSFALNVASNLAMRRSDVSIVIFSLEMTKQQLAQRVISSTSGIESGVFRTGVEDTSNWAPIIEAVDPVSKLNIYIDDTSGISTAEIKAKSRRVKNLGLIIVDYLQLMSGSTRRSDSRVNEISEITRAFKIMAKELNVPIILLSQLSRDSEKLGRRPRLSDLRDSGSIEQDADIVLFLHRDIPGDQQDSGGYGAKKNAPQNDEPFTNGEVTLIVAKNRHGEVTNIPLHWDGAHTRFTAMDYRDYDN